MIKRFWPYVLMAAALFAAPLIAQVADSTATNPAALETQSFLVYVFALITSLAVDVVKRYTNLIDNFAVAKTKFLQPGLVWGLSIALPWAWSQFGFTGEVPTADIVASAPAATVVAIMIREVLWKKLLKKEPPA